MGNFKEELELITEEINADNPKQGLFKLLQHDADYIGLEKEVIKNVLNKSKEGDIENIIENLLTYESNNTTSFLTNSHFCKSYKWSVHSLGGEDYLVVIAYIF